jgi:hypothetical protein
MGLLGDQIRRRNLLKFCSRLAAKTSQFRNGDFPRRDRGYAISGCRRPPIRSDLDDRHGPSIACRHYRCRAARPVLEH